MRSAIEAPAFIMAASHICETDVAERPLRLHGETVPAVGKRCGWTQDIGNAARVNFKRP